MTSMEAIYEKSGGKFRLIGPVPKLEDDKVVLDAETGGAVCELGLVHESDGVAVAYCRTDEGIRIYTHGPIDQMRAWIDLHNERAAQKAELLEFDPSTSADVVNQAISDPVELAKLL